MPLGKPLLDVLGRMRYGGLVLDAAGQVLRINDIGKQILREYNPNPHASDLDWARHALKTLLYSEGASRFQMNEDAWVAIRRDTGHGRPLILRAIPITDGGNTGPHMVVILISLDVVPQPTSEPLRKIFDLTPSEARLAVEISAGKSPEEIAEATHVAIGTVRKQLHSIFAKTGTHRQAELVALLAHVAILP